MKRPLERAIDLHRKGKLSRAERAYRSLLDEDPDDPAVLGSLGRLRLQRGDAGEAASFLVRAVRAAPTAASHHELLAHAYRKLGNLDLAVGEYRLALRCGAPHSRCGNALGRLLLDRGEPFAALEVFLDSVKESPGVEATWLNLSIALNRIGDHGRAIEVCERILAQDRGNRAALTNLGMAYRGLGRRAEAKEAFQRAGDFAQAQFNLGYLFLQVDDLARGFPLCERRREISGVAPEVEAPEWTDGPAPGGTLAVIPEQGLGDTILMSRFFPELLGRFDRVVSRVPRPLSRLVGTISEDLEVVTDLAGLEVDVWCRSMSLPYLLGVDTIDRIPSADPFRLSESRKEPGPLRIGLNWAGNPRFPYDAVRSTRLEELSLLLKAPGVEWVSLHKGHREREAEEHGLPQPLCHAHDFYDTALVIRNLDLVVSTETAIPNLSAALGVPTCVLTTLDPDWRWGSWYPSAEICRQDEPGNWYGAIARALEAIRRMQEETGRSDPAAEAA
ncbi:MAG: tetratricopeptide repeat protein [Candidatus Eisenbacteria bacterium]|nr:tetratricopeptide repeat protein [Candidatus Latescibacterota bacterium]MBD3301268.1 tetratricopeptide repeat protein [Candidatus Eisenbacteria bacterium]